MKFIVILYVIFTIIACNKDSDKIICYNDRDVKIRIDIPYGAYINEKCIIEGEVNKPITMQIFVDSIKIGEIFGKDTLSWIPTEDKFHPGNNHLLRALVYVCTKGSKELTKMFLDSPLTIRKREDNE